jgi:hypothetical protein
MWRSLSALCKELAWKPGYCFSISETRRVHQWVFLAWTPLWALPDSGYKQTILDWEDR